MVISKPFFTSEIVNQNSSKEVLHLFIPSRSKLAINKLANYLGNPEAWGSIIWSILKNGIGCHPYDKIIDQLGIGAVPTEITPIEFDGADLLQIIFYNNYSEPVLIGFNMFYDILEGQ